MSLKNNRIFYLVIAVNMLMYLPLLNYGFIQTLDMSWGPNVPLDPVTSLQWLPHFLIKILSKVVGDGESQKILLISLVSILLSGIYKLLQPKKSSLFLAASILSIFNPFFYTRLMAGQWLVLLGYAILPWAVAYWWRFLQAPNLKSAIKAGLWFAAIGLTSIHTVGIFALAAIIITLFSGRQNLKPKLVWTAAVVGIFVICNALWLVPLATGHSQTGQNISGFTPSEFQAFATQGTVAHSVPLSAALLTGFWADGQNRYILPSSLPIWYVGATIIAVLVVAGGIKTFRSRDRFGLALMVSGFIAWLLGMGLAWGGSAWLTHLLLHVIPFYNGYREPQKWLMLLALAYAYLAAVGAAALYGRVKQYRWQPAAYVFVAVVVVAPFLFSPALAWGAAGQLRSADYPAGWYQAKAYLRNTPADTKVLSLPWHLYLPLKFTGRVVANPSNYFFDQDFIVGNNFELRGVPDQDPTALTNYVGNRLTVLTSEQQTDVAGKLRGYGISYIMLLKEADWHDYGWLDRQPHLQKVVDNASLTLYKVQP